MPRKVTLNSCRLCGRNAVSTILCPYLAVRQLTFRVFIADNERATCLSMDPRPLSSACKAAISGMIKLVTICLDCEIDQSYLGRTFRQIPCPSSRVPMLAQQSSLRVCSAHLALPPAHVGPGRGIVRLAGCHYRPRLGCSV